MIKRVDNFIFSIIFILLSLLYGLSLKVFCNCKNKLIKINENNNENSMERIF